LRLIYVVLKERQQAVPLVVYKKGALKSEADVVRAVKEQLKEIIPQIFPPTGEAKEPPTIPPGGATKE